MRGIAGHPADTDRDTGFKKALAEYPDIKVAKEIVDQVGSSRPPSSQINDILSSGTKFDGIWTSGIDNVIVDALKTAKHDFVPIVGADNAGFVTQLLNEAGPQGRGGDQPAGRRRRRRRPGAQILDGKKPAEHDGPRRRPSCGTTRPTRARPRSTAAARSRSFDPTLAPRADGQGLDHVHQGRSSSPARARASKPSLPSTRPSRGCRLRRHPRAHSASIRATRT